MRFEKLNRMPDPSSFAPPDAGEPHRGEYWCVKCGEWTEIIYRKASANLRGFQSNRNYFRRLACGHWREHERLISERDRQLVEEEQAALEAMTEIKFESYR